MALDLFGNNTAPSLGNLDLPTTNLNFGDYNNTGNTASTPPWYAGLLDFGGSLLQGIGTGVGAALPSVANYWTQYGLTNGANQQQNQQPQAPSAGIGGIPTMIWIVMIAFLFLIIMVVALKK
jgi:hypothetical protein